MKYILTTLVLGLCSSVTLAKSINCTVHTLNVDKGGYLMPGEPMSVTGKLAPDVMSSGVFECKENSNPMNICLFGAEAEFEGGYYTYAMITNGQKPSDIVAYSSRMYGTIKGTSEIMMLAEHDSLFSSFLEKMEKAGIETPKFIAGDSMLVDDAVKAGIEAGVLSAGEPVVLSINECKIIQ